MGKPSGIKIRRLAMGKKQEELAEAIEYSTTSISLVESGSSSCHPSKVGPWLDFLGLKKGSTERREAAVFMMPRGYAKEVK